MKFFSMTAQKGQGRERTCAMIDAPTLQDAAQRAEQLQKEGFLCYVEKNSTFAIRPSSRRETQLLQAFLNACNRTEAKIHMQSDFDGLLARRQSLMMSFFMALYLNPDKIRQKIEGTESANPSKFASASPSGSGGVEQEGLESAADAFEKPITETPSAEASSHEAADAQQEAGAEAEAGDAVGSGSQDDALAAILGSAEANDGGGSRDVSIDLGDDEIM